MIQERDNAEKAEIAKASAARKRAEIEEKEASRLINIVKRADEEAKNLQDRLANQIHIQTDKHTANKLKIVYFSYLTT